MGDGDVETRTTREYRGESDMRQGPAGPRAVSMPSGIDVWEIVDTARRVGNRPDRAARYLGIGADEARAALARHARDPAPADDRIRLERRLADREHPHGPLGGLGPRLLVDRALTPRIAERLRSHGRDVLHVGEIAGSAGLGVEEIWSLAAAQERVLASHNLGDLLILAGRSLDGDERHPGMVVVSPVRYPRTPLCVDRVVRDLDAAMGVDDPAAPSRPPVQWLEPAPGCPFWPRSRRVSAEGAGA